MLNNIDISIYKNIDLRTFQIILDESLTTSYKILWFKGIIEEIQEGKRKMKFSDIVIRMIVNAWSPLVRYKLSFGAADQLKIIIEEITKRFSLNSEIKRDKLYNILNDNKHALDKEISILCRYVQYRLLSPFYKNNLNGTDHEKQKQITILNKNDEYALYTINEEDKSLNILNDEWFVFLYANQKILKEWSDLKYIKFLQRRNMSTPAISLKIDFINKRDLVSQTKLFKEFLKEQSISDIYSGEVIRYDDFSIDHFIPWSFVLHDELWNLAPTVKNINSSKNDNLPDLEAYMDSFCEFQYCMINYIKLKKPSSKQILESYLNIDINVFEDINKEELFEKLKNTIIPLYQIALNQGFKIWNSNSYINSIKAKSINKFENNYELVK